VSLSGVGLFHLERTEARIDTEDAGLGERDEQKGKETGVRKKWREGDDTPPPPPPGRKGNEKCRT